MMGPLFTFIPILTVDKLPSPKFLRNIWGLISVLQNPEKEVGERRLTGAASNVCKGKVGPPSDSVVLSSDLN
jgi:hypothetical protein